MAWTGPYQAVWLVRCWLDRCLR